MENLHSLELDDIGIVKKINVTGSIKRRLLDIGLIPGAEVKYLFSSPFKEPKAYLIRGTVIALREEESKNILVEKKGDKSVGL